MLCSCSFAQQEYYPKICERLVSSHGRLPCPRLCNADECKGVVRAKSHHSYHCDPCTTGTVRQPAPFCVRFPRKVDSPNNNVMDFASTISSPEKHSIARSTHKGTFENRVGEVSFAFDGRLWDFLRVCSSVFPIRVLLGELCRALTRFIDSLSLRDYYIPWLCHVFSLSNRCSQQVLRSLESGKESLQYLGQAPTAWYSITRGSNEINHDQEIWLQV